MNNIHSIDEIRNIIEDWREYYYPRFSITKDDAQSIPDDTWTKVEYDDVGYDTKSCWDSTNFRFVAPFDGYYHVNASLLTADVAWAAGDVFIIALFKNNTLYSYGFREELDANITKFAHSILGNDIFLEKTDYIEIFAYQNRGSDTNTYNYGNVNSLSIHRI